MTAIRCGFSIRRPGRLGVSYPLASVWIEEGVLGVYARVPLRKLVWWIDGASVLNISSERSRSGVDLKIETADVACRLFVRDLARWSSLAETWVAQLPAPSTPVCGTEA